MYDTVLLDIFDTNNIIPHINQMISLEDNIIYGFT